MKEAKGHRAADMLQRWNNDSTAIPKWYFFIFDFTIVSFDQNNQKRANYHDAGDLLTARRYMYAW